MRCTCYKSRGMAFNARTTVRCIDLVTYKRGFELFWASACQSDALAETASKMNEVDQRVRCSVCSSNRAMQRQYFHPIIWGSFSASSFVFILTSIFAVTCVCYSSDEKSRYNVVGLQSCSIKIDVYNDRYSYRMSDARAGNSPISLADRRVPFRIKDKSMPYIFPLIK